MKKPRFDPWALNPEKFLAKDVKQATAAERPSFDELVSITFSRARRKALVARLIKDIPGAFYRGSDRNVRLASITLIQSEIKKELGRIGIRTADEVLVNLLFFDVVRDPAWQRAWRAS